MTLLGAQSGLAMQAALAEWIDANALRLRTAADLQAWENGTERPPAYTTGLGSIERRRRTCASEAPPCCYCRAERASPT